MGRGKDRRETENRTNDGTEQMSALLQSGSQHLRQTPQAPRTRAPPGLAPAGALLRSQDALRPTRSRGVGGEAGPARDQTGWG